MWYEQYNAPFIPLLNYIHVVHSNGVLAQIKEIYSFCLLLKSIALPSRWRQTLCIPYRALS